MERSDARSRMTAYSLRQWMREQEKYFLSEKLEEFSGNIFLTAKSCQIGVRTLSRKMHYHGLTKVAYRAAQKQLTFERIEKRIRKVKTAHANTHLRGVGVSQTPPLQCGVGLNIP